MSEGWRWLRMGYRQNAETKIQQVDIVTGVSVYVSH